MTVVYMKIIWLMLMTTLLYFVGCDQVKRESKRQKLNLNSSVSRNAKRVRPAKKQKKVPVEPPTGYVHVRARRGEATDSHSLAERVID